MLCDVCQRAASAWCRQCGSLFCPEHGSGTCFRCSGAFQALVADVPVTETNVFTREKQSRRVGGRAYLQCVSRRMPTVHLDDDGPPMCHLCGGLVRRSCRHCDKPTCPEHLTGDGLCRPCCRSALLGLGVVAGMFALVGLLLLFIHVTS